MNVSFGNPQNYKAFIKDYLISIYHDEEKITIIIYNIALLDNMRYEIDLELNDMYKLSQCFNNMNLNGIYNILISLITQNKLKLELQFNDLILSFLIGDVGVQVNNDLKNKQVQLIMFGEKDPNEYIYYLTNEIKKLKNQVNELRNSGNKNQSIGSSYNNNQNISNNNNIRNSNSNMPPNFNIPEVELNSKDYFRNLNIEINENMEEIKIDKKLLDDRIIMHLNDYQLNRLTKLSLTHNRIVSIQGIEKSRFPNLEQLYFNNNCIKDLTSLSKAYLPQLKRLWLFGNDITDISPLTNANFMKLDSLSLSKNEIININPLKNCRFPQLRLLLLDNNNINDISVFGFINFKLEKLGLNDNKIVNVSVFESGNFTELQSLYLYNNLITDISSFSRAQFYKLRILSIGYNNIKSINFLENPALNGLKELYISNNQISDLSVFTRINIGLDKLYIEGNSFDINNNFGIIQTLQSRIGEFNYKKS